MKKVTVVVMVLALLGLGFAGTSKGGNDFGRTAPQTLNTPF